MIHTSFTDSYVCFDRNFVDLLILTSEKLGLHVWNVSVGCHVYEFVSVRWRILAIWSSSQLTTRAPKPLPVFHPKEKGQWLHWQCVTAQAAPTRGGGG